MLPDATTLLIPKVALQLWHQQRSTRMQTLARREQQWRLMIQYTYNHSPYYKNLMDGLHLNPKSVSHKDFPVITRHTVMEHFDTLVTDRGLSKKALTDFVIQSPDPMTLFQNRFVVVHTSGTSGEIVFCAYTKSEWIKGWLRNFRIFPFTPFKTHVFLGAVAGHYTGITQHLTINWLGLSALTSSSFIDINTPWASIIETLNRKQPYILSTYASALGELTKAQRQGHLKIAPRGIIAHSDGLMPVVREEVAKVFQAPLYNFYATTETQTLAVGRPGAEDFVLYDDAVIVESDDQGLLITNLQNWTTPLIRYRIPDHVTLSTKNVPEFPGLGRIEAISGRQENSLNLQTDTGHDDWISPHVINEFFVPNLLGFQVRRQSAKSFRFLIRPVPHLNESEVQRLISAAEAQWRTLLAKKAMTRVTVSVEIVTDLGLDPKSGKFRLVMEEPG